MNSENEIYFFEPLNHLYFVKARKYLDMNSPVQKEEEIDSVQLTTRELLSPLRSTDTVPQMSDPYK